MRILIYSYNYYPEPIGIAPLMVELAEGLVKRGHEVRVITAMPNYPERCIYQGYRGKLFTTTEENGVIVQRSFVWVKPRPGLIDRILLDGSFVVTSFFQALNGWRPDVIFTTVPPLPVCMPATLLSLLYRTPVVLSLQDILPEGAVQVGLLTNKTLIRVFEFLERFAYRSATGISVITEAFVANLRSKGVPEHKITLIPNWVDVNFIRPLPKEDSYFRQAHNLQGKFVVMYSGNIALTQGLQTVIKAAAHLRHIPEIAFVIVGETKALAQLHQVCLSCCTDNVLLVPFQPKEQLPEMLAAADVGLIMQKGRVSFNMPSKIPVLLASGRAIIASVPLTGQAARVVKRSGGGLVIPPEDPAELAKAILSLYNDPKRLEQLAHQARQFAVNTYRFEQALSHYEALLTKIAACGQPTPQESISPLQQDLKWSEWINRVQAGATGMNPEKLKRLQACLEEVASILYEEIPTAQLQDLESIEKVVRTQMLEELNPQQIALFLSGMQQAQNKVESGIKHK